MSVNEYLKLLLGEQKAAELERALSLNQPIVISGVNISGKTTLATVLKRSGYVVFEDFEVHHVVLDKELEETVPNKASEIL